MEILARPLPRLWYRVSISNSFSTTKLCCLKNALHTVTNNEIISYWMITDRPTIVLVKFDETKFSCF